MRAFPRLLRDARHVEIARSDHDLGVGDIATGSRDRIAIDTQFVETVEGVLALQTLVGGIDDERIKQTDVADRAGIVIDVGRGHRLVLVVDERSGLHLVETERGTRCGDVVIDVRRFSCGLFGLHLESLDECRIAHSSDN